MKKSHRPWGSYRVLLDEDSCKVKKICVNPGECLSYQYHHKRSEDWIITKGSGIMRLDDDEFAVKVGSVIHIPKLSRHSIKNTEESELLEFVEVQTGEYFGEDDIVRLEDRYGRA